MKLTHVARAGCTRVLTFHNLVLTRAGTCLSGSVIYNPLKREYVFVRSEPNKFLASGMPAEYCYSIEPRGIKRLLELLFTRSHESWFINERDLLPDEAKAVLFAIELAGRESDQFEAMMTELIKMSNLICLKTQRSPDNFIIVRPEIAREIDKVMGAI